MIADGKPRRGRPPKFIRDPDTGAAIHGLSAHPLKKNGETVKRRYYATFSNPREWFGYDFDKALQRFYSWKENAVTFTEKRSHIKHQMLDGRIVSEVDRNHDIPADQLYVKLAELIKTTDPQILARKTGIRELAWLWQQTPPGPSVRLNNDDGVYDVDREEQYLARPYLADKHGDLTGKEWRNSVTWWNEFCRITGAKTVADLDRFAFLKYRKQIKHDQKRKGRSNAYSRSRLGKIKSIINYAVTESALTLSEDDDRALTDRAMLKMPPKPKPKPVVISPAELQDALHVADEWDTALILTALGCAYLNVDCHRLRWDMIDWEQATIRFDREKSSELAEDGALPRLSVLWKRTIRALRKIEHDGEHVFVIRGRPPHIDTINDHFKRCCCTGSA